MRQLLQLSRYLSFVLLCALTLSACGTIPAFMTASVNDPSFRGVGQAGSRASLAGTPEGLALLKATQAAHGKEAFDRIRDIAVSYDGIWYTIVTKIQPKVTDPKFRHTSEERMLIGNGMPRLLAQEYKGEGGAKYVLKQQEKTSVSYNGQASNDDATLKASSLVMEAYQLFLYPAFYVNSASWVEAAGSTTVNGHDCDLLLALMTPGIGEAATTPRDKVMLYIDKKERLVRRVRLTLEGTATTAGAVVDTDLNAFATIAGVKWPVQLYEDLVTPFRGLPAHKFWVTGLDVNRGMQAEDLSSGSLKGNAARPAAKLP